MGVGIFMLLNLINGVVLAIIGYGPATWQYWVSAACVCGSYISGCYVGRDNG